jgi:hypothetical protein
LKIAFYNYAHCTGLPELTTIVSASTIPFEQRRADLDWAVQTLAAQPADIARLFRQTAQAIAHALTAEVYTFSVQLPFLLYQNGQLVPARPALLHLQMGNFLTTLRRNPCRPALLDGLAALMKQRDDSAASIARLVAYLTGATILFQHIPNPQEIKKSHQPFTAQGELTTTPAQADKIASQLSTYIDHLNIVEQIYPGWTASDDYNELYAALTAQLTEQGRYLAGYYTDQIVAELQTRWQRREVIRGLTLHIPYLDEKIYRMMQYEIVVIPTGRIPFRPEFIVGACRVEQQKVRKNHQFSQATRWQLISQLDDLIQAFEISS